MPRIKVDCNTAFFSNGRPNYYYEQIEPCKIDFYDREAPSPKTGKPLSPVNEAIITKFMTCNCGLTIPTSIDTTSIQIDNVGCNTVFFDSNANPLNFYEQLEPCKIDFYKKQTISPRTGKSLKPVNEQIVTEYLVCKCGLKKPVQPDTTKSIKGKIILNEPVVITLEQGESFQEPITDFLFVCRDTKNWREEAYFSLMLPNGKTEISSANASRIGISYLFIYENKRFRVTLISTSYGDEVKIRLEQLKI